MSDFWLDRWNTRYGEKAYAYGVEPNQFLKEQLNKLPKGNILFGAEGEGRNAVYAAKLGWTTHAFDISTEGRKKALNLAKENNVAITYQVGLLPSLDYQKEQFDCIALIYAHFPAEIKSAYHKLLNQTLKKGGLVVFEAFGKKHIDYKNKNPKVGGPSDIDTLFSKEELKADFKDYEIILLEEKEIELSEGLYHNGLGSVIRFVARKR